MLEVEMKFRVDDTAALAAKLAKWKRLPDRKEVDHYFNAPDRDFARTDEAFRIRSVGNKNFVTYKGPKTDTVPKTRFELELPLADGPAAADEWKEFLDRLGYRLTGIVRKSRRSYSQKVNGFEVQATIDTVEELGTFAEIEVVVEEANLPEARKVVIGIADRLGLQDREKRSYLNQLLAKRQPPPAPVPVVVEDVATLRRAVAAAGRRLNVGLVPTMGALHAGHAALIERARAACDLVVVSIYVNPAQFGPNEDFARYPRTLEADKALCQQLGVDLIFIPDDKTMYADGFDTFVDVGRLGEVYEGAIRPGHFRGVATVVLKLLNQVRPDVAYFGQKDAQQVAVVRQLIRDLDLPIVPVVVPTVREPDGLALSSRNRYLDPTQRTQAVVLSKALTSAKDAWGAGERDVNRLSEMMTCMMSTAPDMRLDYAVVVDAMTFGPLAADPLAIIAGTIGNTRLIDNMKM
jgi:pantoate--beta-alanine ligase